MLVSSLKCAMRSSMSLMNEAISIGKKCLLTGALLPQKKGYRGRKNQTWKGYKVDGGG